MEQRQVTVEVLRRVIGRRLVAVTEARHWYRGRRDGDAESLLHLWLHFADVPPVKAHGCGEDLLLEFAEPYASYDMQEYGKTRVGPAQHPDLLAAYVGQLLLNVAPIQGYSLEPSVAGVRLRFEREDLVVASLSDEWLLVKDQVPEQLAAYLTVGSWLVSPAEK
ncbi:hypothetical protein AB0H83_02785 [Dactylosporangium sp. NPDC050688]|uniref:hypothetical protein n=1 Tax=Dactylosporangium sp. NPDC050688 TaxID=3157217 RepID=UPI0033F29FB8